jgi:uncharacterized protein
MEKKYQQLKQIIRGYDQVWIAFSGGLDSTFLLALAQQILGDKVAAVTVTTPFQSRYDIVTARSRAQALGVKQHWLEIDLLDNIQFQQNPRERCYYCKQAIFSLILAEAHKQGVTRILDGSHADDLKEYRPGRKALQELGVQSPLQQAGLAKTEIRWLAQQMKLPGWDEPSQACLATRFPYGEAINLEKLGRVEKAEDLLRTNGFRQFRVRCHDNLARIEVEMKDIERLLEPDFRDYISRALRELGFVYVTLDLEGFRSGSMDFFVKQENINV